MSLQSGAVIIFFFFSSRRRHTRSKRDWSSDVRSSDLSHAGNDIKNRERGHVCEPPSITDRDRKSTRLNSSHVSMSYAVFCFKPKKILLWFRVMLSYTYPNMRLMFMSLVQ